MGSKLQNATAIISFFFLAACSSVQQKTDVGPLYRYRADMGLKVSGKDFVGMAVTKLTGPTQFVFSSPVAMDVLKVTSCAREDVITNQGKAFVYDYAPVAAEMAGLCPLYIEAYSKGALTSWGFIAFRADESLPAHIDCNGQGWTFAGVTACQTKAGLEQQMTFSVPVRYEAEAKCHARSIDKKTFSLNPEMGFCRATFTDGKLWHRLVLLGYDSVLMRVQ